jgi:hypothetical protein
MEFSQKLHACPILHFAEDGIEKETVEHSDYNGLIDRVAKLVKAGMNSDVDKIRDGLTDLFRTAGSKHKTTEEKNLFVSSLIEGDGSNSLASKKATLALTFTQVRLVKDDSKGVNVNQSSFTVANLKIVLDGGNWANFAQVCWNDTYESLSSWANNSRSKPGSTRHTLCIR